MTGPSSFTVQASSAPSAKPASSKRPFLAWIYAPTPAAFVFALRTSLAACLALGIAFWMELDSPAWAAMTVWAVAQLSRGESLSKARWRIIGTPVGACAAIILTSLAPQAPWLFFPMIALWIGLCCCLATFVSNFRSYALVLAGYTCSIICTDAAPDGNNVFFFAVSRSSYIVLGVACETLMASLFSVNQERLAHLQMHHKLETALLLVTNTLSNILSRERDAITAARKQFDTIIKINDEIEFAEIEMGAHGHEGDHARAALAAVTILLSRGLGMATRLQLLTHEHQDLETITKEIVGFLQSFPQRLPLQAEMPDLLAELQHLRSICRQYTAPHRITTESTISGPSTLTPQEVKRLQEEEHTEITASDLDERVLFVALGELLGDLEQAVTEYHASIHTVRNDHFRFQRQVHHDIKLAFHNGIRSALAILITALIYEITAWSKGLQLIGLTSLICGLYATRENPVLATTSFLKGTLVAWCMAWLLVMVLIPAVHSYEGLILVLGGAMFLGGLAKANPSTAGGAAAYNLLMPAMLGLQNHYIMDEISFYNNNLATVMAAVMSVVIFRSVLTFNSRDERFRLRKAMLHELRALANTEIPPSISTWAGHSTDRFSRILRHAGPVATPFIEAYIQATLATLTLGLNVIHLRGLMDREYLPDSARRPITLVLHYIETSHSGHEQAARIAYTAIRRLRELDTAEHETITRLELTRAITYLVVIAHILHTNVNFLDDRKFFTEERVLPSSS